MSTTTLVLLGIIVVLMVAVVVLYVAKEPVSIEVEIEPRVYDPTADDPVVDTHVKRVDMAVEAELNSYWVCAKCNKVFKYDDYKDNLTHLDTLYRAMLTSSRDYGMADPSVVYTAIQSSLSHNHIHVGCTDLKSMFTKIEVDLRNIPNHKHVDIKGALQYSRGLTMAQEANKRVRGEALINEYLSKYAD